MPPTGGGVGVGTAVAAAGVADAVAVAVGAVVPAPGLAVGLLLGVGEAVEQAVPMIPTRATSATRRNGIGGECRPSRQDVTAPCQAPGAGPNAARPPKARAILDLHDADDVPLRVREQSDGRLGRDLGQRQQDLAAAGLDLVQCLLRIVGVNVELHAWGLTVASGANAAGDAVVLTVHAVAAGVVGVQVPAEDVAVKALERLAIAAGDLHVNDLCRHGTSS